MSSLNLPRHSLWLLPLLYHLILQSSSSLIFVVTLQLFIISSFRSPLVHFNQVKKAKLPHPLLCHVLLTILQLDPLQFHLTSTGRLKTRQNIPDATHQQQAEYKSTRSTEQINVPWPCTSSAHNLPYSWREWTVGSHSVQVLFQHDCFSVQTATLHRAVAPAMQNLMLLLVEFHKVFAGPVL